MGKNSITLGINSTSTRYYCALYSPRSYDACIIYDSQRSEVLSWGNTNFEVKTNEHIRIDNFMNGIYTLFKKGEDESKWNEQDKFLKKAISNFIYLAVEEMMQQTDDSKNITIDALHYLFIVPSEWEEEIRDGLIRSIFMQANLMSEEDHKDRILFFSDLESICYELKVSFHQSYGFKRGQNSIFCRLTAIGTESSLIKLDLIQTMNSLLDFPNSKLFPKVIRSTSLSITSEDIKSGIRLYLKAENFSASDDLVTQIVDRIYQVGAYFMDNSYTDFTYNNMENMENYEAETSDLIYSEIEDNAIEESDTININIKDSGDEEYNDTINNDSKYSDEKCDNLEINDIEKSDVEYNDTDYTDDENNEMMNSIDDYEMENYDVLNIIDNPNYCYYDYSEEVELTDSLNIDLSSLELTESQKQFIKSICPFDICEKIGKTLFQNMKHLLSNQYVKVYELIIIQDEYSSEIRLDPYLIKWLEFMLEYSRLSFKNITKINKADVAGRVDREKVLSGPHFVIMETIATSDMYCESQIIPNKKLDTSLAVFTESKPNAIFNMDISFKRISLSCSVLDENGFITKIFDHSYFAAGKCFPSLEQFYEFSNDVTLIVKRQFIPFADKYFSGDPNNFSSENFISPKKEQIMFEIKNILNDDNSDRKALISIKQQRYIKAFLFMYIFYITEIIFCKPLIHSKLDDIDMNIGYIITVEKAFLDNVIKSVESLQDIIYASGLIRKNDDSKKLRIAAVGEKLLPVIQQQIDLELNVKSYFVMAQIHEDYIQLTLNQTVTKLSAEEKAQESVIILDKVVPILNIHDSLFLNMWNTITHDNNLIHPCCEHKEKFFEMFSQQTKKEFKKNFKAYILNNVLKDNSNFKMSNKGFVGLNDCHCKVHLTMLDIINISFKPVLQDIAFTIFSSLINKDYFIEYPNIEYLFALIYFNQNSLLQPVFTDILKEEADYFNPKKGIETKCLILSDLPDQLLRPILKQKSLWYKGFQIGDLHQVYSQNYVFSISSNCEIAFGNKLNGEEETGINQDNFYSLFNKGDIINITGLNVILYVKSTTEYYDVEISFYRYKESSNLDTEEQFCEDSLEKVKSIRQYGYDTNDDTLMISVTTNGTSSSLWISVRKVGEGISEHAMFEIGEPLTLSRY